MDVYKVWYVKTTLKERSFWGLEMTWEQQYKRKIECWKFFTGL